MLPKAVWEMPKLGTINLHASLLPNYRGAAPINWAIINGETKTGVTTFFIDDKIDTGAMIANSELTIDTNENAGQLHDRLMLLGSETIIKTLELIENDQAQPKIQNDLEISKTAYKLNKENCKIDWSKSANQISRQVRVGGAFTTINGRRIKILNAQVVDGVTVDFQPGQVCEVNSKYCCVATGEKALSLIEVQPEAKSVMKIEEWLNGARLSVESLFGI